MKKYYPLPCPKKELFLPPPQSNMPFISIQINNQHLKKMLRHYFLTLIGVSFLLWSPSMVAQISQGGTPYSFTETNLRGDIQTLTMPSFDLQQLLVEDSLDHIAGGIPYRFGKAHEVLFNLSNSGTWETLENGDRIWRLRITSPDAYSINLLYDHFHMPDGGKLYIYNDERTDVLGAFTSFNHNPEGTFSTFLTRGESTNLEYYEPAEAAGQGVISINSVVHGYRAMFANNERGYGDAGACNINVNCPQGDDWQNQKRGVGMVMLGSGTRWCSGSLINNTAQDGTPYFLTANHCRGGESNWIIVFNYESPGCENQNGPLNQTIQYTTLRAFNSASDFALVELSAVPPAEYEVYYSGWSRIDEPHDWSCGIHHPRGDIKKISFDHDPVTSSQWSGGLQNTHWRVHNWEEGTTEPASSGSPLFDPQQRIVGQLHGGSASCTSITHDLYGKTAVSWDYGSTPGTRLKEWLDPLETGVEVLDGWDPNNMGPLNDANLYDVIEPKPLYCSSDSITPVIVLRNTGHLDLSSVDIIYTINSGDNIVFQWEGLLLTGEVDTLYLAPFLVEDGNHQFRVYTANPNGTNDDNPFNDGRFLIFGNNGHDISLHLTTGDESEGLFWTLTDENDELIYTADSLDSNTLFSWSFCLAPGCYTLTIDDTTNARQKDYGFFSLFNGRLQQLIVHEDEINLSAPVNFCLKFPAASFVAEQDTLCSGTAIQFHNLSIGGQTYFWEFEGGNPANSAEENPLVTYNEPGLYPVSLTISDGDITDSFTRYDYMFVVICTAMDEMDSEMQVLIAPNPGTGLFTINLSNSGASPVAIRLFNTTGQLVYEHTIDGSNQQQSQMIDISKLPDGVYILQLENKLQTLVKKLIKR
jgi:lysyl endopeptidase